MDRDPRSYEPGCLPGLADAAVHITSLSRRVRRQNEALERYARALEQAAHPNRPKA